MLQTKAKIRAKDQMGAGFSPDKTEEWQFIGAVSGLERLSNG
jgi:hypothetical protein